MPEVDFTKARILGRGRHVERARRSFELIIVDKKLVAMLGGPDKVAGILRALADAMGVSKPKRRRARNAA